MNNFKLDGDAIQTAILKDKIIVLETGLIALCNCGERNDPACLACRYFTRAAKIEPKLMNFKMDQLHSLIKEFEAMGCWYMVQILKKMLEENNEQTRG